MNENGHSLARHFANSQPAAFSSTGTQPALMVGSNAISAKDQIVLRSLLKVLDNQHGLKLEFNEAWSDCDVVFVSEHWLSRLPPACVGIHVIAEDAPAEATSHAGLSIRSPLRLSNTTTVLHAAAKLLGHTPLLSRSTDGLARLLDTLLKYITAKEKNIIVLPLGDGGELIVNFAEERYCSPVRVEQLLEGRYEIGEPRRARAVEVAAMAAQDSHGLRRLVWLATHRLGATAEAGLALPGHFRLLRWPDAMALAHPGFPRLSALLTSRPHTIEQACAASGASIMAISYFLKTNLALGIAEAVEFVERRKPLLDARSAHATPPPSILGRIRDRLKLW